MDPVEMHYYAEWRSGTVYRGIQPALILILLLTTACSLINRDVAPQQTLGHDQQIAGEGVLVCSQVCRERRQCGTTTTEEPQTVVLAGLVMPRTDTHDIFLPAQTRVTINAVTPYTLRQISNGEEFSINFYNVTDSATGQLAWVAGWCVAQPTENAQ